jgi:hypothetical protein
MSIFRNFDFTVKLSDSIKTIQQESIELEAQFEEVLVLREPLPEDINLLKKSLDKQKEYQSATTWGRFRGPQSTNESRRALPESSSEASKIS